MRKKTQVLTQDQHDARIGLRMCPVCADWKTHIVKRGRVTQDPITKQKKFGGFYWECEEHGYTHYYLSPGTEKTPPCETAGVPLPQHRSSGVPGKAGVIKRRR